MSADSRSSWGRGFDISSAGLDELRQKWADAGREAWDKATRLGQDIKARTRAELEALGRDYLEQAKQEREQAQAINRGIAAGTRAVAGAARRGAAEVKRGAQAYGHAQAAAALAATGQQVQAADEAWRFATMPPAPFLRQGTENDPGAGRLYEEFRTGSGPQDRVLGATTSFTQEFVQAPSVRAFVDQSLADWRGKNGLSASYRNPRRADFGVTEFTQDALAGNQAAHVIGTFGLAGARDGDAIDWRADNDMSRKSYYAGRLLQKAGLPTVPSRERPGPQGTTHQTILFRTDLQGRPIVDDR